MYSFPYVTEQIWDRSCDVCTYVRTWVEFFELGRGVEKQISNSSILRGRRSCLVFKPRRKWQEQTWRTIPFCDEEAGNFPKEKKKKREREREKHTQSPLTRISRRSFSCPTCIIRLSSLRRRRRFALRRQKFHIGMHENPYGNLEAGAQHSANIVLLSLFPSWQIASFAWNNRYTRDIHPPRLLFAIRRLWTIQSASQRNMWHLLTSDRTSSVCLPVSLNLVRWIF